MNENIYEGIAEGNPFAILLGLIMVGLFIGFYLNGANMGTHEDTGRPVKSFNTREGKRAGQRRRYHENKNNYNATPRTGPRKTEKLTFQSANRELGTYNAEKVAWEIADGKRVTEHHVRYLKNIVAEINGNINTNRNNNMSTSFYDGLLSEYTQKLKNTENKLAKRNKKNN